MKKTNLILLLLCAIGVFGLIVPTNAQKEEVTYRLTLDEAIDFALKNNQTIKTKELDKDIAESQVGEILADGLPQVNGNVDFGYNYKIQRIFVSGDAFDPNGDPNETISREFGTDYNGTVSLGLEQMVFDGAYFIGLKAARTFTELSSKDHIKTQIDVVEAVSKAYYLVLVNQERKKLINTNYQRIDSLLRDTQLLYKNGFAERIDVSRVKVQFNNIKVEKNNIEDVLDLSQSLLKFQMGISPKVQLELVDEINLIDFTPMSNELVNSFSYDRRIEYSQLQTQKELNQLDIRNINSRYIPKLDLYGSLGMISGTSDLGELVSIGGDRWSSVGVVGLRMSVPIFDGLRKSNQVQQRKLKARQIDYSFMQLRNSIDTEIEQATANYNKSTDNMEAQRENMELAADVYRVTKIKFEEGVGSNSEVLDADATLTESQTNYYNALYDALISKIELEKALGTLMN